MLTEAQKTTIAEMRLQGYAVVVFSPDEVEGVAVDRLESRLVSDGHDHIDDLRDLSTN